MLKEEVISIQQDIFFSRFQVFLQSYPAVGWFKHYPAKLTETGLIERESGKG
jgi:hypothetical protein